MSKYHNQQATFNGIAFDSKHERDRYCDLLLLERAGNICDLHLQVSYLLIPAQRGQNGAVIERACTYRADFTYKTADGVLVVEDAKGVRTREYIIKRKLMLQVHGIRVREV